MESDSSYAAPETPSKDRIATNEGDKDRNAKKRVKRRRSRSQESSDDTHTNDATTTSRSAQPRPNESESHDSDSIASSSSSSRRERRRRRSGEQKKKKKAKAIRKDDEKSVHKKTKDRRKHKKVRRKDRDKKSHSDRRDRKERRERKDDASIRLADSEERTSGGRDESTAMKLGIAGAEPGGGNSTSRRGCAEGDRSVHDPAPTAASPLAAAGGPARRGPMTREQYEAERSVVRHVLDVDTGRVRLVRGNGEIIEQIVSRDDHLKINRVATAGDGDSYARQIGRAAASHATGKSHGFLNK